jgi:dTDP-4-dehydrorhamnose reductase
VEYTVNRVSDKYLDQMNMSGHAHRFEDLALITDLGFNALRFPLIWERLAPFDIEDIDWTWADERLSFLRDKGVRVIAGLVHHGSGPHYTNLLDPDFPEKLVRYATRIAERYPWIDAYTPVNEPLTTARFSGLYGHWYPHARDTRSFLTMLFMECLATSRAMKAIREINPAAELIQTEDIGKAFSTPLLSYQAKFENQRRWLSLDILAGKWGPSHPLWHFSINRGIPEKLAREVAEAPCPPNIIGLNHYITSNRFLDEHLDRYPPHAHGGNGRHSYADVEAVWLGGEKEFSIKELCIETWERYQLPLAITEAHLGCTRDEQMRWLGMVWNSVKDLHAAGMDIRAVTVWNLLGSFDWDSLVTQARNHYESGVYDLRAPNLRPTALATMVKSLAHQQSFDHPVLDMPGWWERPLPQNPFLVEDYFMEPEPQIVPAIQKVPQGKKPRQLLITGKNGALANAFAYVCTRRGLPFTMISHHDLDIADEKKTTEVLEQVGPWALIHAADYPHVDKAEHDADGCFHYNVTSTRVLAEECRRRGLRFMMFSSDLVFDGGQRQPYTENSPPSPLNIYGKTKHIAEMTALDHDPKALVIRSSSSLFGPWDLTNFLTKSLHHLLRGQKLYAAEDLWISPTYLPDLASVSLDLLIDEEQGIWHLANIGETNWAQFARTAALQLGLDPEHIISVPAHQLSFVARRPAFSVLGSERGQLMPHLEHAIDRYIKKFKANVT